VKTVASKLAKYNSDIFAAQVVNLNNDSTEPADNYIFFYGSGNANHHLGTSFVIHKRIISAVRMAEFYTDRM
jgi:hypothetical protein